jgi:hypothetical protein
MTITDNGRRTVEQLVAEARGMASGGRVPSPTALKAALRIGWERATEVHEAASRSIAAERAGRRRESRAALKRLASKRRTGRPVIVTATPSRTRLDEVLAALDDVAPATVPEIAPRRVEDTAVAPTSNPSPAFDYPAPIGPMPAPVPTVDAANEAIPARPASWPIVLIAMPAFAAVWSGWVGLGGLTGFGVVQPFPGIPGLEGIRLDTAITLPIGVETYGAYALYIWLSGRAATRRARRFAMWSAFVSLALGAAGQVTYHLLVSDGPWVITTAVSCLPVLVLGMAAALRHLVHAEEA